MEPGGRFWTGGGKIENSVCFNIALNTFSLIRSECRVLPTYFSDLLLLSNYLQLNGATKQQKDGKNWNKSPLFNFYSSSPSFQKQSNFFLVVTLFCFLLLFAPPQVLAVALL